MADNTTWLDVPDDITWVNVLDHRTWLDVPYAEKEEAKAQGARWDPAARRWYAPRLLAMVGPDPRCRAWPRPRRPQPTPSPLSRASANLGRFTAGLAALLRS